MVHICFKFFHIVRDICILKLLMYSNLTSAAKVKVHKMLSYEIIFGWENCQKHISIYNSLMPLSKRLIHSTFFCLYGWRNQKEKYRQNILYIHSNLVKKYWTVQVLKLWIPFLLSNEELLFSLCTNTKFGFPLWWLVVFFRVQT